MLEKIIKKAYTKVAFSFYGILGMMTMLLPLVVIGFGIYFMATGTNNYGPIWIVIGVICILFSIRKLKDLFGSLKYVFAPTNYPVYKNLKEDGIDVSQFDKELEEADVIRNLTKNNPVLITENFIFGWSQVSFFCMYKKNVMWAYEYNGNGIVFYDNKKNYGFTFFPKVDGNDELIERLKVEMPYIYFGTDFDYKTIMHEDFDNTVILIENERQAFLSDPEAYREKKLEEERIRIEEEKRRLEEEKNKLAQEGIEVESEESSNEEEEVTEEKTESTTTTEENE